MEFPANVIYFTLILIILLGYPNQSSYSANINDSWVKPDNYQTNNTIPTLNRISCHNSDNNRENEISIHSNSYYNEQESSMGSKNHTLSLSDNIKTVNPELSSSGNNVYVVWEEGSYGKSFIVLRKSNDSGASFSPPLPITNSGNTNTTATATATDYSVHPDVAASGNSVYIVWKDSDSGIYFKKSDDRGKTFGSNSIKLNEEHSNGSNVRQGTISDLHISASGNLVYIVWKDSNSGIYFKKSNDRGATYGPLTILTNNTNVSHVKIMPSGNSVHIVWQDTIAGNYSIFYKRSLDGARSFDSVVKLDGPNEDSYEPEISTQSNNVFIVWKSANAGILFRASIDNGASFLPPVILSNATNVSDLRISSSDNYVSLVWKGSSIILRSSTIKGLTFGNEIDVSTTVMLNLFGASQIDVSSAVREGIYLVWSQPEVSLKDESRSSYSDILYVRLR